MENQDEYNEQLAREWDKKHRRGKMMGGLLVVAAGVLFLARELGAELPYWIFSWKIFLIGIGLVMMVKHGFSRVGWIIPILIGGTFLISDLFPALALKPILWPSLLIVIGLFIMFKPRRKFKHMHWQKWQSRYGRHQDMCQPQGSSTTENFLDSTSVMGGVKKNILSKNFKGGNITNVFGGAEINLMQADFEGKITLEVTQLFGGTKLIIPSNWVIHTTEMVAVFGSIEDKRPMQQQASSDQTKILVLSGVTIFGGISITSY
ncbi:MAG: DUF5668 domain-containing protein [bacterium]|nr:DUF5668 domain-containing protein [bacterium]